MIDDLAAWLRSRSARERVLIQALCVIAFCAGALWTFDAAGRYRESAAAELTRAHALERDVRRIAAEGAGSPGDRTPLGIATATASAMGLSIEATRTAAPGRVSIVFAAADSALVFRWMNAVMRQGVLVTKTSLVRQKNQDTISSEFELAPGAS